MYMWISSCHRYEFANSAFHGCTSTTLPSDCSLKPLGWFIQALTAITIHEPVKPVSTIGIPVRRCSRGDRRPQP